RSASMSRSIADQNASERDASGRAASSPAAVGGVMASGWRGRVNTVGARSEGETWESGRADAAIAGAASAAIQGQTHRRMGGFSPRTLCKAAFQAAGARVIDAASAFLKQESDECGAKTPRIIVPDEKIAQGRAGGLAVSTLPAGRATGCSADGCGSSRGASQNRKSTTAQSPKCTHPITKTSRTAARVIAQSIPR